MEQTTGIVLMAAGASSRLGHPKQLLPFRQTTLLQNSIDQAQASNAGPVVLVLGAQAAAIQSTLLRPAATVLVNEQWQEGISASIRLGLTHLLQHIPGVQRALFMTCDQPHISAELLDKLVTLHQQTGAGIVASGYAGTAGIPAVFSRHLFDSLLQLEGDTGAKKLLLKHQAELVTVPFELGTIDIDTAADYGALDKQLNKE